MADAQPSGSMTPEQLEHVAIKKQIEWNLYNLQLSDILSGAVMIKDGKSYEDEIVSKQEP